MYIKDMSIGEQIEGFFLLQDAFAKTTMGGETVPEYGLIRLHWDD